jgi:hypothetical protein
MAFNAELEPERKLKSRLAEAFLVKTRLVAIVSLICAYAAGLEADRSPAASVQARAQSAERVVVAAVESVQAVFERNEFGDELIVSRAWVRVREVMKGADLNVGQKLEIDVEGGTIGEVTLRVSDMPTVAAGENAILFLTRTRQGRLVPHMRGLGILKIDKAGRVDGSDVTLAELRPFLRGR